MASVIIIPIVIVAVAGLSAYLVYRYAMYDFLCKRSVNQTLKRYNIKKTPSQIIKEYYEQKDEKKSHKEILNLEKYYRQKEPDQFLAMYDVLREK
ncbi:MULTISPECIES: hypothetical protein [Nitrosopumilus]|uniref:Uncharacterized protein n=1 Tax=Nitrosopumilus piranensis TaxID=1582439 RepID=A0A0C5BS71_9ARCH|nr:MULTISPECIES: hypothetical protein [Nitrosopumilus]AJM92588.1 hypothetical protein NPIRD3C_1376 [Nitrosopumilus piranensis]KAF6244468.1 hypothetical protein C6989_09370 [Nitrosopumilus sp. b2]